MAATTVKHASRGLVPSAFVLAASLLFASIAQAAPAVWKYNPDVIAAPPGYKIELVAGHLDYPVDVAIADDGTVYAAEAGGHTYGTDPKHAPPAQIVRITSDGKKEIVYDKTVPMEEIKKYASSDKMSEGIIPPITGLTWHGGKLYVSHRSRYSVFDPKTGEFKTIVNGLPSWGEFQNNKPIFDASGKMVFFLSTQGNSGVIEKHWMKVINAFEKKDAHEIPGEDVELTGVNFPVPVEDPTTPAVGEKKMTGVYSPLGSKTVRGQVIEGQKICNGAFFRCDPDGSNLERIAWGFRSCFGYRYSPEGRLICTQNSANPMPPRGIWFDYESIYEVVPGEWYGWPDFYSGIPITDPRFQVHKGKGEFVLTAETHRKLLKGQTTPRQPLLRLPPHSALQGFVFGKSELGITPNDMLVAEFGAILPLFKGKKSEAEIATDEKPPSQVPPDVDLDWPGFRVSLIDLDTGRRTDFLRNRSGKPSSAASPDDFDTPEGTGLERPIQLEWGPDGSLYVVDFGIIEFQQMDMTAHPHTGAIWRVRRDGAAP